MTFNPTALISALGNAVTEIEGVVTSALTQTGLKPDVVSKVQAGLDAFKTAAGNLSATMTADVGKPIIAEAADAFTAVDNALTQLPLGAREAQIAQIAGFVVPTLLNAARVFWH